MLKFTLNRELINWLCYELCCKADEADEFAQTFIERLKYRWNHCQDPLPGEIEPVQCGPYLVSVIWASPVKDVENHIALRRLRGLIGYGPGWTFWNAFWDWCLPTIIMLGSVAVIIVTICCALAVMTNY